MTIANGVISGPLDMRVRRFTQPLLRPHIGVGVTEEGRSGWQEWVELGELEPQTLGLELKVDTLNRASLGRRFTFRSCKVISAIGGMSLCLSPTSGRKESPAFPGQFGFRHRGNQQLHLSNPQRRTKPFRKRGNGRGGGASPLACGLARPRTCEGLRSHAGSLAHLHIIGLSDPGDGELRLQS